MNQKLNNIENLLNANFTYIVDYGITLFDEDKILSGYTIEIINTNNIKTLLMLNIIDNSHCELFKYFKYKNSTFIKVNVNTDNESLEIVYSVLQKIVKVKNNKTISFTDFIEIINKNFRKDELQKLVITSDIDFK